jgi:hypothetical protein
MNPTDTGSQVTYRIEVLLILVENGTIDRFDGPKPRGARSSSFGRAFQTVHCGSLV